MKKLTILLAAVFTLAAFVFAAPVAYAGEEETVVVEPTQKELTSKTSSSTKTSKGKTALPKGIVPRTDVPDAKTPIVEVDSTQARLLVRYKASDKNEYRVAISYKGGDYAYYTLYAVNADEYFPLSQGNGKYDVMVLRVLDSTGRASIISKTSVTLNAKDKNAAFLSSNYYVKWEGAKQSQSYVNNLTKKTSKGTSTEEAIYNEVVRLMNYDYDMIGKLDGNYVPDMDTTLKTKKGVCYDISVLLAGMLRYSDVPTRLVMGYSTEVKGYHAWNEILINGKWVVVDATYDTVMESNGVKYTMVKKASGFEKINQY